MLNILTLQDIGDSVWDDYVKGHPFGNYCHLAAWFKIIESTYGHSPIFLAASKDAPNGSKTKKISGLLPIIHLRRPFWGSELISMPFLDLGGLISDNPDAEHFLIHQTLKICQKLKPNQCELRQSERLQSFQDPNQNGQNNSQELTPHPDYLIPDSMPPNLSFQVMRHKVRMLLDLPETSTALMKSFKSKLRSQIKKPIKEGLACKVGRHELLSDFYSVFCQNMKDLGSPVHAKRFMENVLHRFGECATIFVIYQNHLPLAASLTIGYKNILSNPWASSLKQYSRLAPNMFLYWAMLEYACNSGYRQFDFGRCTPGEGTFKFKAQWGAKPFPLYWYSFQKIGSTSTLFPKNRLRQSAQFLWPKLPIGIANSLGPMIRKYISL